MAAGNSRKERPGTGRPPVLFLSHSGVDTEAARELKRRLEESPDARAAGLTVWFDKDDLPAGRDWMESLEDNIAESTAFAVYVGSRGVVDWVRREVRLALTRSTSVAGYPFIPVFANESAGETDLPPFARQHQGVRDPLADPDAMAKLLRAVLGLEPDAPVEAIDAPYVGLRAMDEAEADRFFGRERELDELVDKVRERRLVALVADSGTGKSSLVRAGLIPAWRRRELAMPGRTEPDGSTWHVVVTRPGTNPQAELGKAVMTAAEKLGRSDADKMGYLERVRLPDPSSADRDRTLEVTAFALLCGCPAGATQTLLVVDQFEELFTQAPPDKRAAFVDLLLHLTDEARSALPFRVVLTLRADYESLLREFPALRAALDRGGTDLDRSPGEVRLKGLSDDGLARIVHEPMRLAGHTDRLDRTRLLNAIRQDLDRRPGDTALLAVALFRVWEKYRPAGPDDLLTVYHEIGRIAGALGDAARETIGKLAPGEQALLQGLWARLVQPGEGRAPTRRIAQLDELGAERQRLARSLADESRRRLLLTTATTVEIAHETLFAQWDVLREFVVGNAQPLNHLGRLMTAARDWNELPAERRPRLSPFDRLRAILGWQPPPEDGREQAVEQGPDRIVFAALARDHPDWLSDAEHRFVAASGVEAERKQANEQWVTKSLAAAGGIATSGAVVATILAGLAIWFGIEANQQAKSAQRAAEQAEDAAKTAEDAALIAERHQREALRQQRVAEEAALQARRERNAALISQSRYVAVAARRLVAMGDSGTALSLLLEVLPSHVGSPDRPWEELAEGSLQVALLHLRERRTVRGHESGVLGAVFSADGRQVLTASYDRTARLWDAASGKELVVLRGHERLVYSAVLSADGSKVLTASSDRTARLWDAASGKELVALRGHENDVVRAVLSPDGTRVLTASYDRTARLWDAAAGRELAVLRGHENEVIRATFSPDGRRVLTASTDGTARLWDTASGRELIVLRGHESVVYSAVFSADGARVLTASADRTARLWDAASGKEVAVLHHEDAVLGAVFSADEARVVTASADGTAVGQGERHGADRPARPREHGIQRGALGRRDTGGDGVERPDGAAVGRGERQGAGRPARARRLAGRRAVLGRRDAGADGIGRQDGAAVGHRGRQGADNPERPCGSARRCGALGRWNAGGHGLCRRDGTGVGGGQRQAADRPARPRGPCIRRRVLGRWRQGADGVVRQDRAAVGCGERPGAARAARPRERRGRRGALGRRDAGAHRVVRRDGAAVGCGERQGAGRRGRSGGAGLQRGVPGGRGAGGDDVERQHGARAGCGERPGARRPAWPREQAVERRALGRRDKGADRVVRPDRAAVGYGQRQGACGPARS